MLNWKLGLKIGPNSIGWCSLEVNNKNAPLDILNLGVRVFDNGREPNKKNPNVPGTPLAAKRTKVRDMRRRYERIVMRRRNMCRRLAQVGLFPQDEKSQQELKQLDCLKLRNNAISVKLEPYEIGRALFHLQQKRGFKSSRKEAQQDDGKLKGMKLGIGNLKSVLGERTLGQYLYQKNMEKGLSSKFRPYKKGIKLVWDFYPGREMVEQEFNKIWEAQKQYHPGLLTEEAYKIIHKAIFHQRPLKPQPKGRCSLVNSDDRMEWAVPSAQRFRIIKEINNIAFTAPEDMRGIKLNQAQRRSLYNELCTKGSLTFKQIKKLKELGLSSSHEFNLEAGERDKLKGDVTAQVMRDKKRFGDKWDWLDLITQDTIIRQILSDNIEDETLEKQFMDNYQLTLEQAQSVINAPLPAGVCSFGETVINSILPKMLEGLMEHEAIAFFGWKTWEDSIQVQYEKLPYYGEVLNKYIVRNYKSTDPMVKQFGYISNPTLHIVLNQLRKLLNKLKENYGCWPDQIIIEVERNLKKGVKEITKIEKEIWESKKNREKWRKEIEIYKKAEPTPGDYLKMKLWHELAEDPTHRKCVYTGKTISISMLFSDETQIGYILPYSRTLDNSNANMILMTTEGAYIKGNQTPYEAFSDQCEEYGYEKIQERIQSLPKSKQWRFRADAMEIFASKARMIESKSDLDGGGEVVETGLDPFAARPLCDTDYIAKLIKKYLGYSCRKKSKGVIATPGTLTGLLGSSWGLNDLLQKEYPDHRKKAIDAFTVSLTTYYTVRRVVEAAQEAEKKNIKINKLLASQKPFPSFDWEHMKHRLEGIYVSYKPDHCAAGRLHEDNYYGRAGDEKNGLIPVVSRVPFYSLVKRNPKGGIISYIDNIRDKAWLNTIKEFVGNRHDIDIALQEFATMEKPPLNKEVRSIRLIDKKPKKVLIGIDQKKFVQGGSNHRAEIYLTEEGKWQMEVIRTFDANQKGFIPDWKKKGSGTELVMRLHINDIVSYEEDGQLEIRRVKKISARGIVHLTPHNAAKEKANSLSWEASAKQLQLKNAAQILVKVDGSVFDPSGRLTKQKKKSA